MLYSRYEVLLAKCSLLPNMSHGVVAKQLYLLLICPENIGPEIIILALIIIGKL